MDAPPSLSDDLFAALPREVLALLEWQANEIKRLSDRIAALEAGLAPNPNNSSKPPSSEHPHAKTTPRKPKSKRQPGGQPGHAKHQRALIPTEQCQEVVPCLPSTCRRCGVPLTGTDPDPLRHQVWELPPLVPVVTEYQQHRLVCRCGCSTCGELPAGVSTCQAGPQLIAFSGLLMACFRQSKRRAALFLSMILKQPASPGWLVTLQQHVAEAVQPAYDELAAALPAEPQLHVDESPTKQGQAKSWVWTFVARTFTLFACSLTRAATVPQHLLGTTYAGIIHCDRARMYWAFGRLQYCWAHLKRDFQGLIDSPCGVRRRLGHALMRPTKERFALWQKVRDGTLTRGQFQQQMPPIRQRVESLLLRGYFNARVRGFCKDLWEHRERLWLFVDVAGVEPTNNAAEQALRQAVIWRKLSFGTQSAAGSRFVERMLTVVETCRRQKRDVYAWLVETVQNHFADRQGPSLLPTEG